MNTHLVKEGKDQLQTRKAKKGLLVKPGTNSLDWYELTETSNYILNTIIAYASTAQVKEQKSPNPDRKKITYLEMLYEEAYSVNRNTANFQSLEKMQEIIDKYSPVLKSLQN
jgi:hypothetical protein